MCLLSPNTDFYDNNNNTNGDNIEVDYILVPLDTFPNTLKKTTFYKTIYNNHKNNPKIPLPSDIYKNEMNLSILLDMMNSLTELIKMIPGGKLPYSNYDFIIRNKKTIIRYLPKLKEQFALFEFMEEIEFLVDTPERNVIENLIQKNNKHLLIYCLKNKLFSITPQLAFNVASKYYNIDILEYIFNNYKKECNFYGESDSCSDSENGCF